MQHPTYRIEPWTWKKCVCVGGGGRDNWVIHLFSGVEIRSLCLGQALTRVGLAVGV